MMVNIQETAKAFDAEMISTLGDFKLRIVESVLIRFFKDGQKVDIDIKDGKLSVETDLELTEAAQVFFDWLKTIQIDGLPAAQYKAAYEAGKREAVPEGWQLVPIEPTTDQLIAGAECDSAIGVIEEPQEILTCADWHQVIRDIYAAMLRDAPKAGE